MHSFTVGITICKEPGKWLIPEIPHIFVTDNYRELSHPTGKTAERIDYLSKRRNEAHKEALECFPDITHFFDVDSYYTEQDQSLRKLAQIYRQMNNPDLILGGATWISYRDIFRVLPYKNHYQKYHFWDTWTTPEATNWSMNDGMRTPHVEAVGGVCIYPIQAFQKNGFGSLFFPKGSEYNQLCNGFDVRLCMTTPFFHPTPTDLHYRKRLRVLAGRLFHA